MTRAVTRLGMALSFALVLARPEPAVTYAAVVVRSSAPVSKGDVAGLTATPAELDQLLGPVALYPDELLGQMLICASDPGKVSALGEWLAANDALKGSQLQDAARKSGFGPSFVALVLFPEVAQMMTEQHEWTTRLGQEFAADRSAVFGSIQRLRAKARSAGTLRSTPQQDVETKTTSSGQQVIVIEPANPQVVYVPQYDSQVVYTQPATSTVVVQQESSADAAVAGLIGFTAGVAIGAAIDNDYYYGPYGWHGGGAYMYDDAWDDWNDNREDAREDWQEHREDVFEDREDIAEDRRDNARTGEQRTEQQKARQENRSDAQGARGERGGTESATTAARSSGRATDESRGYGKDRAQAAEARSGTRSDAFSGYSSGRSERSASSRGERSRSSSRKSGGGRRR